MVNLGLVVVIIGIVLWLSHSRSAATSGNTGSGFKIPTWLFKGIGIFLLVMLVLNASDFIAVIKTESRNWWPIVKENAQNMSTWLREFFGSAGGK